MNDLTLLEKNWVLNCFWAIPWTTLFTVLAIATDSPGEAGDEVASSLFILAASVSFAWGALSFLNRCFEEGTNGYGRTKPQSWTGRQNRAKATRGIRKGGTKAIAVPRGARVDIYEVTATKAKVAYAPNLWPIAMPWEGDWQKEASFNAETESEKAMECFNELEARLERNNELSDGDIEARALAAALNS